MGLGALGSYFLGCFQKKKKKSSIKILKFLEKIQDFQIFQKKKKKEKERKRERKRKRKFFFKVFNSFEKFKFSKKKKKSSLNSSSGTESYDPLPYFSVVQHQVNCPPSAFFEAWNMSQTRGIRQVCRILFNK